MIAIVHFFQPSERFFTSQSVALRHLFYSRFQPTAQLFFRYTAKCSPIAVERNILQIIQVAKNTEFAEFRHSGQQPELNVAVLRLEHGIKQTEDATQLFLKLVVADVLKQRLVILVHQYRDPVPCLFVSTLHNSFEAQAHVAFSFRSPIFLLPNRQSFIQRIQKRLGTFVFPNVQIKMEHGAYCPIFLQTFHGQAFEQFFLPLEISLESRNQKRFTEPSRAAQEIITTGINQFVYQLRFVYIQIVILPQSSKILYAYGKSHLHNLFKRFFHKDNGQKRINQTFLPLLLST